MHSGVYLLCDGAVSITPPGYCYWGDEPLVGGGGMEYPTDKWGPAPGIIFNFCFLKRVLKHFKHIFGFEIGVVSRETVHRLQFSPPLS